MRSDCYVIFELGNEHVAIHLLLPDLPPSEADRDTYVEKRLRWLLGELGRDWDKLVGTLDQFSLGRGNDFHLVRRTDDGWVMSLASPVQILELRRGVIRSMYP